jgi:hypothetical protein
MIRRFLWAAYWACLATFFFGLNLALAAPPTTTDAHNRSCSSASQLNDVIMGTVGPWVGPVILLGIIGIIYVDRTGSQGLLHQAVSIVGQNAMAFVLAASAMTIGSVIVVANGVAACP